MKRRVVITGMGVVAPNGIGRDAFWNALKEGRSGIKKISLFDPSPFSCRIAGEVSDFDPLDYIPKKESKRMARFTQFAVAAARMAISDAGLDEHTPADMSLGIIVGVSGTDIGRFEQEHTSFLKNGPTGVSPFGIMAASPNAAVSEIAKILPPSTTQNTIANDCNSGLDAIGLAFDKIRGGEITCGLCGATDTPITPLLLGLFCQTNLLPRCTRTAEAATISRPFDLKRMGGLMAEGAAIFIMEEREEAVRRKAVPYAEVLGYGSSVRPGEAGLEASMRQALTHSLLAPSEIDYLSAHGPSDPLLDRIETRAIKNLFGERAFRIPVSSIKSMVGNPLAVGGPLQLAGLLMSFREGILPPTINYNTPDPECDLDYVPNTPRYNRIRHALINSRGIGGKSSSLVVKHA